MCDKQSLRSACAYAQSNQSLFLSLEYYMTLRLLTEKHIELLSLKGGFTGSSESTLAKMPHCWKSHVAARLYRIKKKFLKANLFIFKKGINKLRVTYLRASYPLHYGLEIEKIDFSETLAIFPFVIRYKNSNFFFIFSLLLLWQPRFSIFQLYFQIEITTCIFGAAVSNGQHYNVCVCGFQQ